MFAYWLLFAVFAIGAAMASRQAYMPPHPVPGVPDIDHRHGGIASSPAAAPPQPFQANTKGLFVASLVPIILIGFRYRVGADYGTYAFFFKRMAHLSLGDALNNSDVGYATLSWLATQIGAGLWLVNLVCGILFTFGLVKLAKLQPNPWLAITIAVPYLVIIVGMGLSRQAVAIGLGMAGLGALTKGSYLKFGFYVLVGALFHRSALVLLPIVGLSYSRNRVTALAVCLVGSVVGYYVLVSGGGFERFQENYVQSGMFESKGAPIRLAMNIPPALLFLMSAKRFSPDAHQRQTYMTLSIIAFISVALLVLYPTVSTAIDRLALYVIPLQIFVLSRLPSLYPDNRGYPSGPLTAAIILYSAVVEFVWLNFAYFASSWVPYQFVPLRAFS